MNYCQSEDEAPKNNPGAGFNTRSEEFVENAVAQGNCLKADTIDELLAQMEGMDVDTAKKTIERYNEVCKSGTDTDFGKGFSSSVGVGKSAVLRLCVRARHHADMRRWP